MISVSDLMTELRNSHTASTNDDYSRCHDVEKGRFLQSLKILALESAVK